MSQTTSEWEHRIANKTWQDKNKQVVKVSQMTELHIRKCMSMMNERIINVQANLIAMYEASIKTQTPIDQEVTTRLNQGVARANSQLEVFKQELYSRTLH